MHQQTIVQINPTANEQIVIAPTSWLAFLAKMTKKSKPEANDIPCPTNVVFASCMTTHKSAAIQLLLVRTPIEKARPYRPPCRIPTMADAGADAITMNAKTPRRQSGFHSRGVAHRAEAAATAAVRASNMRTEI